MREYSFTEFGRLSAQDCKALATALNGKSFMNFQVHYSNWAGNCTLIVEADADDYTEEEVKHMFLHVAMTTLAELIRNQNN